MQVQWTFRPSLCPCGWGYPLGAELFSAFLERPKAPAWVYSQEVLFVCFVAHRTSALSVQTGAFHLAVLSALPQHQICDVPTCCST